MKEKKIKQKRKEKKNIYIYIYISVCVGKKISCFLIEKSNQHHMIRLLNSTFELINLMLFFDR